LEDGTTIESLDRSYPLPGDVVSQGDDHLRLIKKVLKAQFPGEGGQGFSKPITATEDEINNLEGLSANIMDILQFIGGTVTNALFAPEGTVMMFAQPSPPGGWRQRTSRHDYMLRVVSDATGGGIGGTDSPTTVDLKHSHTTAEMVLSMGQLPPLDANLILSVSSSTQSDNHSNINSVARGSGSSSSVTSTPIGVVFDGKNAAHGHGPTGTFDKQWKPKYLNIIQAVKN